MPPAKGHPKTVGAAITTALRDLLKRQIRIRQQRLRVIEAKPLQFVTRISPGVFVKGFQKTPPRKRGNADEINHLDGAVPIPSQETQTASNRRMTNQKGLHARDSTIGIRMRPPDFRQSHLKIRRTAQPPARVPKWREMMPRAHQLPSETSDLARRQTVQRTWTRANFSRYCLGETPVALLKANQKLFAL